MRKIASILLLLPTLVFSQNKDQTSQNTPVEFEQAYEQAFSELKNMLEGNIASDFKRAVFVTENAYFQNRMNYHSFNRHINNYVDLAKLWMSSNRIDYPLKDSINFRTNAAVFHVLTDTTYLFAGVPVSLPINYDTHDIYAENQWTQMFVTKLLVTKSGNCHSLPYLYKILCKELGTKAYLALAPNHIYIKQRCKKMGWYNTDLTSRSFPIDAWIMSAGYVNREAILSGIYMDTLSDKQSIALCLADLAKGYEKRGCFNPQDFALRCTDLALKHYKNSINALLLKVQTLKAMYEENKSEEMLNELTAACQQIVELGYKQVPESVYRIWEKDLAAVGSDAVGSDNDTTRTGHSDIYQASSRSYANLAGKNVEILTLSDGRYPEVFKNTKVQPIGNLMYNTETHKIESFTNEDTTKVDPTGSSRWLSRDPLAKKYPSLSPYHFAGNNPILYHDADGREIVIYYRDCASCSQQAYKYTPGIKPTTSNEFVQKVHEAVSYNMNTEKGTEVWTDLHNSDGVITISQTQTSGEVDNGFVGGESGLYAGSKRLIGNIYWDPDHQINIVDDGELDPSGLPIQKGNFAPSTVLLHEGGHGQEYNEAQQGTDGKTTGQFRLNIMYDGSKWDNPEEERNITEVEAVYIEQINKYETDKAKETGGTPQMQPERTNHGGTVDISKKVKVNQADQRTYNEYQEAQKTKKDED